MRAPRTQGLLSLAVFAAVSVVTSWPLATAPGSTFVTRQFDLYGVIWLTQAAPGIGGDMVAHGSMWPLGEYVGTLDSYVLFALVRLLPWVGPVAVVSAMVLVGPVLSAWAAERYAARALGAGWPWSLLAGLAYGFGPCVTTALLEGHVYDLLNPWLPLLAWTWGAALSPSGRVRHGLAAATFWLLAVLTSAYVGVCATLLVVVWFFCEVGAHLRWRPLAAAAAVALPAGFAYIRLVASGLADRGYTDSHSISLVEMLHAGSARPSSLAAWYPLLDTRFHSITAVLGFATLALVLAAPVVMGWRFGPRTGVPWRRLVVLGVVATVGALGPVLRFPDGTDLPLVWAASADEVGAFFRFPARLLWLSSLGFGATAAVVATRLVGARWKLGLPLLIAAAVDAIVGQGTCFRLLRVPAEAPSAYRAIEGDGAVLELIPEFLGTEKGMGVALNGLVCSYQRVHGHPLLNHCLTPFEPSGPRVLLSRHVFSRLLGGDTDGLREELGELGVGFVVHRPDLLPRGDRQRCVEGLSGALGPPLARSVDGGELVVVYRIEAVAADPMAAWQRIEERP